MLVFDSITIDLSGVDSDDKRAAVLIVEQENERRAALDNPIDALPIRPSAALLASYKTVLLEQILPKAHTSYINQGKDVSDRDRKEAYHNASQTIKDQIDQLLGL